MTASAYNPRVATGYRLEELAVAFDRVMNPRDWMAPINSAIPAAERGLVEQAVLWFTKTVPRFDPIPGHPGRLAVTAFDPLTIHRQEHHS